MSVTTYVKKIGG